MRKPTRIGVVAAVGISAAAVGVAGFFASYPGGGSKASQAAPPCRCTITLTTTIAGPTSTVTTTVPGPTTTVTSTVTTTVTAPTTTAPTTSTAPNTTTAPTTTAPAPATYWRRLARADWPEYHKGLTSTVTDTLAYPQPAGSPTANWIRYFLDDGSLWNDTERNEGSNTWNNPPPHFREGDIVWFRWWEVIELLPVYSGDWNIIFQTHLPAGGTQPTAIFAFDSQRRLEFKTSTGGGHTTHWVSPLSIPLRVPFKIKLGIKFSSSPLNGWVELWFNDTNVVPRKPVATLGTLAGWDSVYIKQGLYRSQDVVGDAVYYTNGFEAFTSDPE